MFYEEYWGLGEAPFENTPDPRFLYYSRQHQEGLMRLIYVIRGRKGAGMLTGVFGCGKTALGRTLLTKLEKDTYKIAFITNPRVDDIELLRLIAYYLGVSEPPIRKADLLIIIENLLINNMRDGKETVIIIDEAHAIEDKNVFEEIRLLLNFQIENRFLLTLLLFGQPELKQHIDNNKQLSQRIAMRYHLTHLDQKDTLNYVLHRLKIAEQTRPIFTDQAINLIHERSGGIPRRINQICDVSLFTGCAKNAERIDRSLVQEAIESIEDTKGIENTESIGEH